LDGQKKIACYSNSGSLRHREAGVLGENIVQERAYWTTTKQEMLEIANARTVDIRIKGSGSYVDRSYGTEDLTRMREFIAVFGN